MTTNVAVSLVLVALGVGVALPVLVQAFVTLRTVNRVVTSLDQRAEGALAELSRVVGRLEPASGKSEVASLIGAALVPAIAAAVRSLRHAQPHDQSGAGREASKTGETPTADR